MDMTEKFMKYLFMILITSEKISLVFFMNIKEKSDKIMYLNKKKEN